MLTKQKIPLNVLKKILNSFDLGKIKKIKPLATSGNISYLTKSDKGRFFLRLCPTGPRWRSKKEIASEIQLLEYLKTKKFPVITPLKTKKGGKIIFWKKHYGYLRRFLKAKPKLNPIAAEVKKFGQAVGQFHRLIENFSPKYKRRHIFDLAKTQKYFSMNKKKILTSSFKNRKEFVVHFEKEIFPLKFPNNLSKGMIHEDLGKRHILWEKGKIIGMVDFDRAYYGKLVLDLGQACRGWCFDKNWKKWNNENFRALISGYECKRKLSALEKEYLFNAIKFGILERALSFYLRYIIMGDKNDANYAWQSIADNGILGELEKNREKINKILFQ